MKKFLPFAFGLISMVLPNDIQAQTAPFTTDNYQKALWMTTRMYGGQRSGENNWYVYNHLPNVLNWDANAPKVPIDEKYRGKSFIEDNDAGYDLSGGWHDCGDHVKFGQTEFYSGYVLLKGYAEFPLGYDDHYNQSYQSYGTSGKWNWEEDGHEGDGIPDIVNEVKHATDFFIKCAKDANTFYYQIGDGDPDHKFWVTSVLKQTMPKADGGQVRTAHKNPNDASMPSFCGATLALMGRIYKVYDPAYSELCIKHAKFAYEYAKKQSGTIPAAPFYPANESWKDDFVTMCSELYWATGEEKYKTEALSYTVGKTKGAGDVYGNPGYAFCYNDNGDIALYNLALLGKPNAASILSSIVKDYQAVVDNNGLFNQGGMSWGPLRYNANVAWITALDLKLQNKNTTVPKFIYDQIDYILGKNSANLSFVVGFGEKSPSFPHHRDIYCADGGNDRQPGPIPARNKQAGFMVGGTRNPSEFQDTPENYVLTEGGIDYNSGLVGALGYINSIRQPVDQSKFPKFQHVITSTQDVEEFAFGISVYPNPSVNDFTVDSKYNVSLKVYDNLGQEVEILKMSEGKKSFGQELLPGVYHLNFIKDGQLVKRMNVVKNW